MLSEKEKLEEELRFLEESFQIGVITKEEFENGKRRVELKLKGMGDGNVPEDKPDFLEKPPEPRQDPVIKVEDILSKKEKIRDEPIDEEKQSEHEQDPEHLAKTRDIEEIMPGFDKEEVKGKVRISRGNGRKGMLIFAAVVLVAVLGSWFLFFSDSSANPEKASIICSSNNDCSMEGKKGICLNSGTEKSECKYTDRTLKLTVLNSRECFNCQTERVLSIMEDFFPNPEILNLDVSSEEGKKASENLRIDALPTYIFNSSLQEEANYDKMSNTFNDVNDNFILKNSVANPNYYFKREKIENKLDLFFKPGQEASTQAEKNLKEFLDAFEGDVVFEKHDSNSDIAKGLGINSFPAFLVNNQIKFSGVQPADIIKENFCKVNDLEECELELSKNLIRI